MKKFIQDNVALILVLLIGICVGYLVGNVIKALVVTILFIAIVNLFLMLIHYDDF